MDTRLGNIPALQQVFNDENIHVGYSGHEVGFAPTIVAVTLGAKIIERHFCLSRHSFVHHIECSLEPDEFADMVNTIHQVPAMMESGWGVKHSEKKFLKQGVYGGTNFLQGGSVIK
jgi:sialic acid synthase SpsE